MSGSCGLMCDRCPAAARCGRTPNFCLRGRCGDCADPLLRMDVRQAVIDHLGGLDLAWRRPVRHPQPADLPDHLPVLVQAYADAVDVPWVALHGGRVFGAAGRGITPKHRLPLGDAYRLILAPNFSVWRDHSRFEQLVQQRRAFAFYHELVEAGLPAVPDVGWSLFEPDGRLWAEWINGQPDLQAVSIFCGGRKIHAERRALRETVEDIALFHRAVRPEVTFILGGVHAPERLVMLRRAAPGRRLVVCNGMAYACAQRRRVLGQAPSPVARSARECFLLNCSHNDRVYAEILRAQEVGDAV
jgi:hypothetical protein